MISVSSSHFSPTKHNPFFFLRSPNPRIRIIRNYYIFAPSSSEPPPSSSLRLRPSATVSSSFSEGGDDRCPDAAADDDELPEMARAFGISSRTASAVCAAIAFAALALPLAMPSVTGRGGLKTQALAYATLLSGFYMAWNIGANDVANAMGTSVGSGALTLRQAVLTSAVLEFAGAFLMGTHVTSTMQKGILVASVFRHNDSILFAGLLSSLAAAGTWLQVASFYGWPVSTTHCIVGAMVGFGLVYGGIGAVFWSSLARVTSSWVISPLMGAAASFLVYKCIRRGGTWTLYRWKGLPGSLARRGAISFLGQCSARLDPQGCNLVSQCCDSYEYCVSCCLDPSRTPMDLAVKVKIAKPVSAGKYGSVFDFCAGRCRHNSASVVHENAYASDFHHCFSLQLNSSGLIETNSEARLTGIDIVVGRLGESCNSVCMLKGQSCVPNRLFVLNRCELLRKYMSCKSGCYASTGADQPAEVADDAPNHMNPGACLYTQMEDSLTCDGSHQRTRRLCPCA